MVAAAVRAGRDALFAPLTLWTLLFCPLALRCAFGKELKKCSHDAKASAHSFRYPVSLARSLPAIVSRSASIRQLQYLDIFDCDY